MTSKKIIRNLSLVLVVLVLMLAYPLNYGYGLNNEENLDNKLDEDLEYVKKLIQFIKLTHPDEVSEEELIDGAIKGMFLRLDEYSDYYTPEEFKELTENVSGDFGGIGLYITEKNGYITVITPIEGTPGFRAGIKPGDIIVSIDDKDIVGINSKEAADLMKGEPGTEVKLGVVREGTEGVIYFNITRELIKINPVTYEVLNNNIGYIKIIQFNSNTLENIVKALDEFDNRNINRLIIDLRNNPGGYLDEVVNVLRLFVPEGPIVNIKKSNGVVETYESYLKNPKYKLAVLVNEGSASASEIFAGAVKDTKVGLIIGTQTFGKGTVQSILPLARGGGIKITTAEYFTAKMNKVHGIGIEPDIIVENIIESPELDRNLIKYLNKERKPTLGTVGLDVLAAEDILKVLGYKVDTPDGVLDEVTFNEIKRFQSDNGLHDYGVIDFTTQDILLEKAQLYTTSKVIDKQIEKAVEVLSQ